MGGDLRLTPAQARLAGQWFRRAGLGAQLRAGNRLRITDATRAHQTAATARLSVKGSGPQRTANTLLRMLAARATNSPTPPGGLPCAASASAPQ